MHHSRCLSSGGSFSEVGGSLARLRGVVRRGDTLCLRRLLQVCLVTDFLKPWSLTTALLAKAQSGVETIRVREQGLRSFCALAVQRTRALNPYYAGIVLPATFGVTNRINSSTKTL